MAVAAVADDAGAPWLSTMLELAGAGIKEYPGGADNPIILGWARHIGLTYPEQADYADGYKRDDIAWCGVTMAEALAKNGIRPPFGPAPTDRWMWADSFSRPDFADKLDNPRKGAITVFDWDNGGGHVGALVAWDPNRKWVDIAGGNQSDAVNVSRFKWDHQLKGFYWPRKVAAAAAPERTPPDVRRRMGESITLAEARIKNGKVVVYPLPANDGGGSFEVAGINERYHPVMANKLRKMIEDGEPDRAVRDAIGDYTAAYTDVADAWTVSWGIEHYLRGTVFHRGPRGAAIILQLALKHLGEDLGQSGDNRDGIDGEVGPLTAAAMRRQEQDVPRMLDALRWAREYYEENYIGRRENFWDGFINRWNNQRVVALRFHAEQPKEGTMPTADQPQIPIPPPQPTGGVPAVNPFEDFFRASMTPEQEIRMLRMMVFMLMMQRGVDIPNLFGGGFPTSTSAQKSPEEQPQASAPAPAAQPAGDPTKRGVDLVAQILGLFGAGGAALAGATGTVETSTAIVTGIGSIIPLVGGMAGLFNPTLGRAITGIGTLLHRLTAPAAAPPTNPPTR